MSKDTQNDEEGVPPLEEPELNQTSSKIAEGPPQEKKDIPEDDFLKVVAVENSSEIENTVKSTEKLTEEAVKPKEPSPEKLEPDTPEISLESVLKKAGVEMSSADLGTAQEMIHSVKLLDNAKPHNMSKIGTKLAGINTLIENYPGLAPYADEFSQVFENAAEKPETIKFMQENYLNSVREKFGSAKTEEPKVEVEKNSSQSESPDEKPLNQSSSKIAEEQEEQEKKQEEEEKKKQEQEEEQKKNQEQEAEDSVIFSPSRKSKGRSKGSVAENIDTSDVIDPITQAIRDEVLYKQQLLLQQEIAKNMEGQEKEDFLDQDLTAIRAFLQTPEGKQAVDDVMKNPQLRKEMHAIERDGYKTVHSKFSESFRDVDWGKINEDKVRTTDVKDADGNPVCTLKETTVDTKPQSITLADGTTQTINKYRQIDFPIELETGNGPMHVSMAVRDANGKPISAKEAVYFTAHYDDNGKLTEVSSPTPVHFAGDGPDAIGYIEVDGKVFPLPVTKEKYQDMMKEVAINNGLETDISKAADQIYTKENSPLENELKEKPLAIEDAPKEPKEKPLAIEDAPKEPKEKPLAIEDAPKEPKEKPLAIEDAPKEPKEKPLAMEDAPKEPKTEMQEPAKKAQESREARDNPLPEPEDKSNKQTEAQKKAEELRQSREDKGNPSAEPPVKANSGFASEVKKAANNPDINAMTGNPVPSEVSKINLSSR